MNVARSLALFTAGSAVRRQLLVNNGKLITPLKNQIRNDSSVKSYYRKTPDKVTVERSVAFVSGVMWWWIIWHFLTEYEEFIGAGYPDPSKWTDEELGVPPI